MVAREKPSHNGGGIRGLEGRLRLRIEMLEAVRKLLWEVEDPCVVKLLSNICGDELRPHPFHGSLLGGGIEGGGRLRAGCLGYIVQGSPRPWACP